VIKLGFSSFDVRCFGPNKYFFNFLVSFCQLDLGMCAKTVFNKIRCTAASAERIFAVPSARDTRAFKKSAIYKKSSPKLSRLRLLNATQLQTVSN